MPTIGSAAIRSPMPGHRLRVGDAVAERQIVHAARVVLAQVEQLVFEQPDQHRHVTIASGWTWSSPLDHGSVTEMPSIFSSVCVSVMPIWCSRHG